MKLKAPLRAALSLILAFSQVLWSWPSYAANEPTPLPAGKPYYQRCEGVLEAFQNEKIAEYFVGQATSQDQRFQLLADYGYFFTKEFQLAIIAALDKRKITPNILQGFRSNFIREEMIAAGAEKDDELKSKIPAEAQLTPKQMVQFAKAIHGLVTLGDEAMDQFVVDVLDNLQTIHTGAKDQSKAEVVHLQLVQLRRAIESSPDRYQYQQIVKLLIRNTLIRTMSDVFRMNTESATLTEVVGGIGAVVILFVAIVFQTHELAHSLPWLPYLGAMGTAVVGGGAISVYSVDYAFFLINPARIADHLGSHYMDTTLTDQKLQEDVVKIEAIYRKSSKEMLDTAISLEKACQTENLCELSPVQIAYLGHVDMLEMEKMAETLEKSLNVFDGTQVEALRKAIDGVLEHSQDYRKQIELVRQVKAYVNKYSMANQMLASSIALLDQKIDAVTRQLEQIQEKPYSIDVEHISEDVLTKNEMILAKLSSDLAKLGQKKLDHAFIRQNMAPLEPVVAKMGTFLDSATKVSSPWRQLTEDLSLAVDQIPSRGAP